MKRGEERQETGDGPNRASDARAPRRRPLAALAFVAALLCLAACDLPRDPNGTMNRVRGGTLVVGIVEGSSYASLGASEATGEDADLARRVADTFGAEPRWTRGTADQMVAALDDGAVDLAIGGIPRRAPWTTRVALTASIGGMNLGGERVERAFALPLGENRWMLEVNRVVRRREDGR